MEESGLYGSNHISGIVKGKHYYRGINAHTQFWEALYHLYYESFKALCDREEVFDDDISKIIKSFEKSIVEFSKSFENVSDNKKKHSVMFSGLARSVYLGSALT